MKSKDKKEIFAKTVSELRNILKEKRNNLFGLNIEHSQKKLKNTRELFLRRKEIAVILTVIREKELEEKIAAEKSEEEIT